MAKPISKKPIYNLNLVLQETGIKADTLRAWERRYQLPQPERTEGGHRLFSDYDIETIRWLIARQEEGMRISRAVELWKNFLINGQDPIFSMLANQVTQYPESMQDSDHEILITERNSWVEACLNFNESNSEQVLAQAFSQFPMETVCVEIIQKGISEIGTLWYQGKASIQQEHFASALAIRRLNSLLAAAPPPFRPGTVLISNPAGEDHTFSPLLITLFLRYRSWNVIYLGANVPEQQFIETIHKTQPDLLVMSAMRLGTAATLQETANLMQQINLQVAYGGRIFNLIPSLAEKIPGHFLGNNLYSAIATIEELITNPIPVKKPRFEPNLYAQTIVEYSHQQERISTQTLDILAETFGPKIPLQPFREANQYLVQDLVAALTLGDLDLLGNNSSWVENFLAHRDFPQDLIFAYFTAYLQSARTHLGESGQPIITWLSDILNNLPQNH